MVVTVVEPKSPCLPDWQVTAIRNGWLDRQMIMTPEFQATPQGQKIRAVELEMFQKEFQEEMTSTTKTE